MFLLQWPSCPPVPHKCAVVNLLRTLCDCEIADEEHGHWEGKQVGEDILSKTNSGFSPHKLRKTISERAHTHTFVNHYLFGLEIIRLEFH